MTTQATKTTIDYATIKKTIDLDPKQFALVDDITENAKADKYVNYVSIHLVSDKKIDTRKVFCLYLNKGSVTIHCATRFDSHCKTTYKLNSKKTEYTKQVALTDLKKEVDALLKIEVASMTDKTTVTKKTETQKKAK